MLERKRKLDCANGREKADLVLKNGTCAECLYGGSVKSGCCDLRGHDRRRR